MEVFILYDGRKCTKYTNNQVKCLNSHLTKHDFPGERADGLQRHNTTRNAEYNILLTIWPFVYYFYGKRHNTRKIQWPFFIYLFFFFVNCDYPPGVIN